MQLPFSIPRPQLPDNLDNVLTKRNVIALLVLGVLALAIPIGVKLVQQQQQLRSKAVSQTPEIRFVGPNVSCDTAGNCTTTSTTVELELSSPTW